MALTGFRRPLTMVNASSASIRNVATSNVDPAPPEPV